MSLPQLSSDDLNKIRKLVQEGVQVKQEMQDLNEGLSETIKAFSKEMDIPTKTLRQVINIAFKDNLEEVKEEVSDAEDLVNAVKNTNITSL